MAHGIRQLKSQLAANAARLEEVKRFANVLQRHNKLNGGAALHHDNRCMALEVERDRLEKLIKQYEKNQAIAKHLKNT